MRVFFLSIVLTFSVPVYGEDWRSYWGAGWYTGLQDNKFILIEQMGADLGIYRDNGKGTVIGIAASLRFSDSWIFLTDMRINAMRYPGGKPGQGIYFKSEAGIVHWRARIGPRYWKGWTGTFESIGGIGAGYEWRWRETLSLRLQGQASMRYAVSPANAFYQLFFYLGQWR